MVTFRVEWEPRENTGTATAGIIPFPRSLQPGDPLPVRRPPRRARRHGRAVGPGGRRAVARSCSSSGEPGIGKTRLASEVARRAYTRGRDWCSTAAATTRSAIPYQPFVEALTFFVDHADDDCARASAWAAIRVSSCAWCRASATGCPTCRRPCRPTPRPSSTGCSRRSRRGSRRRRPAAACSSCSTTSTGRPSPRCCCSGTSPARPSWRDCSSWRRTATPTCNARIPRRRARRSAPAARRAALRARRASRTKTSSRCSRRPPVTSSTARGVALAQLIYAETDGNPLFAGEVLRHLARDRCHRPARRDGGSRVGEVDGDRHPRRRARGDRPPPQPALRRDQQGARARGRHRAELRAAGARRSSPRWTPTSSPSARPGGRRARSSREVGVGRLHVRARARSARRCTTSFGPHGARGCTTGSPRPSPPCTRSTSILTSASSRTTTRTPSAPAMRRRRSSTRAVAGERASTQLAHDEAVGWFKQARDLLEDGSDDPLRSRRCCTGSASPRSTRARSGSATTLLEAAAAAERAATSSCSPTPRSPTAAASESHYGVVDKERVGVLERAHRRAGPRRSRRARRLARQPRVRGRVRREPRAAARARPTKPSRSRSVSATTRRSCRCSSAAASRSGT